MQQRSGLLLASASITARAFGLIQAPSYGWLHATAELDLLGARKARRRIGVQHPTNSAPRLERVC